MGQVGQAARRRLTYTLRNEYGAMSNRRAAKPSVGVMACGMAVGAMLLASLAACSSSDPVVLPISTEVGVTSTSAATRVDDGVLRIGILLPASGEGASIGQSARAAVRVAVEQANAAGGVNGHPVELVVRDEGTDSAAASMSLKQLIDAQVDVVVGPASSNITMSLVPSIASDDVVACSPSASALALDAFPNRSLLFRTIASDSLQAEAMAQVIEQTGERSAAIAYVDDAYGRPLAKALQAALQRRKLSVTATAGFAVDDDEFATEAAQLVASGTGALALIGDADAGSRMLVALSDAGGTTPRDIVVNDALRGPWSISVLSSISSAARARIVGVSQSVLTQDADLLAAVRQNDPAATGLFATQAYDCATLFMLAAVQGESTKPEAIAAQMSSVSGGGSACFAFKQCAALLADGRNIDYEGPGGLLQLGSNGDPTVARFEEFSFDTSGRDVTDRNLTVNATGG